MRVAGRFVGGFGAGLMALSGMAGAEPIDGKSAKAALFSPKGAEVEIIAQSFLSDDDLDVINEVAGQQKYYGAVALSPDEGLLSEATVAAANYHDVDVAQVVALAGCDAKRTGEKPCVIVALIRPKGWEAQALQLSADATDMFRKEYSKLKLPRAMAISVSTGRWGLGNGESAAVAAMAACTNAAGAGDCALAILD